MIIVPVFLRAMSLDQALQTQTIEVKFKFRPKLRTKHDRELNKNRNWNYELSGWMNRVLNVVISDFFGSKSRKHLPTASPHSNSSGQEFLHIAPQTTGKATLLDALGVQLRPISDTPSSWAPFWGPDGGVNLEMFISSLHAVPSKSPGQGSILCWMVHPPFKFRIQTPWDSYIRFANGAVSEFWEFQNHHLARGDCPL